MGGSSWRTAARSPTTTSRKSPRCTLFSACVGAHRMAMAAWPLLLIGNCGGTACCQHQHVAQLLLFLLLLLLLFSRCSWQQQSTSPEVGSLWPLSIDTARPKPNSESCSEICAEKRY